MRALGPDASVEALETALEATARGYAMLLLDAGTTDADAITDTAERAGRGARYHRGPGRAVIRSLTFTGLHSDRSLSGRYGCLPTIPASWASRPAWVRFAHSSLTSIRDT